MKREIKFSLVFRDMWQSAGKYVPTVDQLTRVAPAIIEMGCFARVETNGGGFEQVNLLFGENPNRAVREWTKPFHEAGIQTHMLDRALNGLRMSPVPDDVRQLFYQVKKAQGTDIARTFCGLNDVRNIAPSIRYAKAAGMISQCSLCITHSPIHTVEYYTKMAMELIELGADEICIKDMAGIGRPHSLGQIVANIKAKHPEIPVQYHSHAGPGFNVASILEVCNAGCDYIDVGMEPLSWGTGHADLLSVQAMLKDAGYQVPEINMFLAKVIGNVVSSQKDDKLTGNKLLVLRPLTIEGENPPKFAEGKNTVVAVDNCGAGVGQLVLFTQGSSARQATGMKELPIDAAVIGLVDKVEAHSKKIFDKQ